MTHLEIENLASEYLEGTLDPSQRAAVDVHVAGCAACRELLGDVRQVLELCRTIEDEAPRPWLLSRIMMATVGEPQLSWRERIVGVFRPVLQPRIAYSIAMTIFTFSVIVNAAGLSLRSLRLQDLNPLTWVGRANRQGHLMAARAEKFYYDLRVVYEIESRFWELRGQPRNQEPEAPQPETAPGGSSLDSPSEPAVASNHGLPDVISQVATRYRVHPVGFVVTTRSAIP